MEKKTTLLSLLLLSVYAAWAQPEWQFFHASDAVADIQTHNGFIWISSGSGLHQINLATGDRNDLTSSNSNIPGHVTSQVAVDSSGATWVTGNYSKPFLSRFDGVDWQTWTEINGAPFQGILSILPSTSGKVYLFGYFDQSTIIYYENGSFIPVPPPNPAWRIFNGTLASIAETSNGHLWVSLRDSTFQNFRLGEFDGTDWTVHDLSAFPNNISAYNRKLLADNQNNLYSLTGDLDGSTILKYDGQNWTVISATFNINDFNNSKKPMYIDAQHNLWVGLWNNTFAKYDGQNWTTIDLANLGLTDGHPDGLTIDSEGNWWFIYVSQTNYNYRRNLFRYDGSQIEHIDLANSELASNNLVSLLIDPYQNKWASSYEELVKFDGNDWETHTFTPYSSYPLLPEAADRWGNLWMSGASEFIGRYDGLAFTKIDVSTSDGQPLNLPGNIVATKNGTVYFATGEGEIIKIQNGEISYIDSLMYTEPFSGYIYPDFCLEVALSSTDQLWCMGNALHHLDDDTWTEIPLWEQFPISTNGFIIDPSGNPWVNFGISLPDEGSTYAIYNGVEWEFLDIPFPDITYPVWDAQNNIWIGGTTGLYKYDGSNWTNYNIYNSDIPSNVVRDLKIDLQGNLWLALDNAGLAVFNENGIQDISARQMPQLSGTIYRDLNGDQQLDPADLPLAFQKTLLLPDSIISFSSFEGSYQYRLPEGEYEVEYLPTSNWHLDPSSPPSYSVPLSANGQDGQDFRVSPDSEIRDIDVNYIGGFPRCNFQVSSWLNFRNIGTMSEDGVVSLELDPKVNLIWSIPNPSTINGNSFSWDFSNLLPTESQQVYLYLQMPDESSTDSVLYFEAIAAIQDTQAGLLNVDSSLLEQVVSCAFDPNDKLAQPTGEVQNGQSLLADALKYTIRFQNTGNDTAFTVVIRDTLDGQFDLNTLEVLASSHPMTTRLQPNGAMEFRFANILLPDSTTNEPASHGFVRYRVKARTGLPSSTILRNRAYIYFDLNQPVVTNTTSNEVVDGFVAVFENKKPRFSLVVSPNPNVEWAVISPANVSNETFTMKIFAANGALKQVSQVNGTTPVKLNTKSWASGIYWIVMENERKFGVAKLVKQ